MAEEKLRKNGIINERQMTKNYKIHKSKHNCTSVMEKYCYMRNIHSWFQRISMYIPTCQKYDYIIVADERNIQQCLLGEKFLCIPSYQKYCYMIVTDVRYIHPWLPKKYFNLYVQHVKNIPIL